MALQNYQHFTMSVETRIETMNRALTDRIQQLAPEKTGQDYHRTDTYLVDKPCPQKFIAENGRSTDASSTCYLSTFVSRQWATGREGETTNFFRDNVTTGRFAPREIRATVTH
jgi:hypothetical protein